MPDEELKTEETCDAGVCKRPEYAKKTDEASAAKHDVACAKKCEDSGYQLMVGDKHYKLDDAGNEKAKAYLKDAKSTKVTVDAKADGEKLTDLTSIKAAEAEEKK